MMKFTVSCENATTRVIQADRMCVTNNGELLLLVNDASLYGTMVACFNSRQWRNCTRIESPETECQS